MTHGLAWAEGVYLPRREAGPGAHSNSIEVGSLNPHTRNRPLIQASHAREKNKTSALHWRLEARRGQGPRTTSAPGSAMYAVRWTNASALVSPWPIGRRHGGDVL